MKQPAIEDDILPICSDCSEWNGSFYQAESRSRVPSKAERAAQEAAQRDAALATSTLDPSNKGFQMMAKLGFKPGEALGKQSENAAEKSKSKSQPKSSDTAANASASANDDGVDSAPRREPLNLVFKEDRGGIGLDSDRKRKFRELAEQETKRVKAEESEYRERVRIERETRRIEACIEAAQKVAERLDADADAGTDNAGDENDRPRRDDTQKARRRQIKPTSSLPVLYRGLIRERESRERSLLARHALHTSLPSTFASSRSDDDAYPVEDVDGGGGGVMMASVEQEAAEDDEDPELDEFNALEPSERLQRLVQYLRQQHRYCFWCKHGYETQEMEGCPGMTEEDHD